MNCNKCNRLLIARDAKIAESLDSELTLELHCECGAVYHTFVEDDDWIYNVYSARQCERQWAGLSGGLYRWLNVVDYSPCEFGGSERHFMCRIAANDPRPRGRQIWTGVFTSEWLDELPLYQWVEINPASALND